MHPKVLKAVQLLGEIGPKELDETSVQGLCQLMHALQRLQGSIFIKTVGRMDVQIVERLQALEERDLPTIREQRPADQ